MALASLHRWRYIASTTISPSDVAVLYTTPTISPPQLLYCTHPHHITSTAIVLFTSPTISPPQLLYCTHPPPYHLHSYCIVHIPHHIASTAVVLNTSAAVTSHPPPFYYFTSIPIRLHRCSILLYLHRLSSRLRSSVAFLALRRSKNNTIAGSSLHDYLLSTNSAISLRHRSTTNHLTFSNSC